MKNDKLKKSKYWRKENIELKKEKKQRIKERKL